jgi:integrase
MPNGRRKYFYAKTKNEAQKILRQALHARDAGNLSDARGLTVGEFLDQWLAEVVKPNVRPWTSKGYEVHVRMHLKPAIGRIPLERLTPLQVQQLINQKQREGLQPKTIRYIRGTLRAALNEAVRWELLAKNPAALVTTPRVEQYEIKPFTPQEARVFLNAIKGDRLEALYSVALTMGLRQGEALGLRWSDVDLELGYLRITKQLQRINGETKLVEPKTARSRRSIAMPKTIVEELRSHRERQNAERRIADDKWNDSGLVFCGQLGQPLDATGLSKAFHEHLARAGLADRRFHDLRHSCATLLLVQGVSPRIVMDVLGHSQISLTMNTYSHVIPEMRRQAADRMDDLLHER